MTANDPSRVEGDRSLVARAFPRLALGTFEQVGAGWTSATYLVDGEWIVQVPVDERAGERLLRQIEILPELAHDVSGAVPVPELASADPVAMGYRRIDGAPFTDVGEEGVWPERLGRFLYDLHMVPPEFVGMRAVAPEQVREEQRAEIARLRSKVDPLLREGERAAFGARLDSYLDDDANWRFAPCVTHGDLGPEHVLVTPSGDLAGVIDWEEVGMGDPVADFAWLLHAAPGPGERALATYGGAPDPTFRDRGRVRFMLMPWYEVAYGLDTGGQVFVESGLAGVRERADA
jgi:aminoglycoside phosphotransferase (APT) family kinase protein